MNLKPILPHPSRRLYLSVLYDPIVKLLVYLGFVFVCVLCIVFFFWMIKTEVDAQAARKMNETATAYQYQTLTAMPTSTPTITLTPTASSTVTPTFTPTPLFAWSLYAPDTREKTGPYFSLGRSANGDNFLAYFLDNTDELMVIKRTGNSWTILPNLMQLNREGKNVGMYVNMYVHPVGVPFLAYMISDRNVGRYAFLVSDGSWSTTTIGNNLNIYGMDIQLDGNSVPHFAYISRAGEIFYQSSQVSTIAIDSGGMPSDSESLKFNYFPIAMSVDNKNFPHICYARVDKLRCAHKSIDSWEIIDVTENGIHPALSIDKSGNFHLAYYDTKKKSLMYAFADSTLSRWDIFTVDNSANVGFYPSLTIDSQKMVHISYYDISNRQLKYSLGKNNTWEIFIPDPSNDETGLFSSISLDEKENPLIAYYNDTLRQIKIAAAIRR